MSNPITGRTGRLSGLAAHMVTAFLLGAVLACPGLPATQDPASKLPKIQGIFVRQPQRMQDFLLVDQDEDPVTVSDFEGRWSIIYFGYTFCPDVCPMDLARLGLAQKLIAEQGWGDTTAFWFISVDPRRDTPSRLKEHLAYFSSNLLGATGDHEQLKRLTSQVGTFYEVRDPEPGKEYYVVDHSSTLVVINPDGGLQAVLTPPHDPKAVARDFSRIRSSVRGAAAEAPR